MATNKTDTSNIFARVSRRVSGFADDISEGGLSRARDEMVKVGESNNASRFSKSFSDAAKKVDAGRKVGKAVRTFKKKRKIKRAQKKGQMI